MIFNLCFLFLQVLHSQECRLFSAPHFLFLWRVKEKENAPLAVEKKKKAFWVLIGSLVRKTNYGTCVSAECLSICSAFLFAAAAAAVSESFAPAAAEIGAGQIVTQRNFRKHSARLVSQTADTHPRAFSFSSVPSTAHLLFLGKTKKKKMWG
ncbi:MAG: hypothetical protein IKC24_06790 [Oscillospiraceae bacterium]|nr:hypothetical protein [Oscillospiraceae bacterium]